MKLRLQRPRMRWRLVLAALVSIGILHIVSILVAPSLAVAPAFVRLEPLLPLNKMVVLPPVTPGTQPLPFLSPNVRYAMCRFATDKGAIEVQARLPGAGWTLSVHLEGGENIYTATAEPGRFAEVRILLMPGDDRFLGLTPEARGIAREGPGMLEIPARSGIAVVRAPDAGIAFPRQIEADLARASCAPQ
ncbi:MAG: hypothetical protein AB1749_07460 [Pseudomonadota bacterium]